MGICSIQTYNKIANKEAHIIPDVIEMLSMMFVWLLE